jgi:hypothetical protein
VTNSDDEVEINLVPYGPGEDPLEVIAKSIEDKVHGYGWDGQPHFGMIVKGKSNKDTITYAGGTIALPDPFYSVPGDFIQFLGELATKKPDIFIQGIKDYLDEEFAGWFIVIETWSVQPEENDSVEEVHSKLAAVGCNKISEHPARREGRIIVLAMVDGRVLQVQRLRGTDGAEDEIVVWDNTDERYVTTTGGVVLDAMRVLTQATDNYVKGWSHD